MKGNRRFLKSIIASSKSFDSQMPWTRGKTRRASIAARKSTPALKRIA